MNVFQGRKEYKYLVPNRLLPKLRAALKPYMKADAHAGNGAMAQYTIRSIYFDTPNLDYYYEKLESLKIRKKLRVRLYNDPLPESTVFLEIKKKINGLTVKHRAPFLYKDYYDFFSTRDIDKYIIAKSNNGKEKNDAKRFFFHIYRYSLRPMVLVIYDREPLFCKHDPTLRITFDKNLRSAINTSFDTFYGNSPLKHSLSNYFVLEVKFFGGMPAWVDSFINSFQFKRMSVSKYTICIETHKLLRTTSNSLFSPTIYQLPLFDKRSAKEET